MCINSVRTLLLYLIILPLLFFVEDSFAAEIPQNTACQSGMCPPVGGGGGGGGGSSPLTIKLKNDALDRELTPWSCTIDTARDALRDYLETIEGTSESLNLEPLTTTEIGNTIETGSYLELQSELQTPWSSQIKSFHYVYKQYAEIAGEDPVIVDDSHVSFLVKCDSVTGDTRLTSLRGKYFGSLGLRTEYMIKFNPSGFSRTDAIALANAQLESCESTIGSPRFFAIPGQTRLIESVEITTTTDGEVCGNPPIPYGRTIVVTAEQDIYIYDDTSGVGPDITGQVHAYVMANGPYTGIEANLTSVPLVELDVEAYNGSSCFEDLTQASGDYTITNPSGSLNCNFNLPREYHTNSCGLPRGDMIQIKDDLGSVLSDSVSCSPGDTVNYTFNDTGADRERYTPQTNVFYHTQKAKKWLYDLMSVSDQATLSSQTVKAYVNTNDGDCEAEHQFGARTMHFSKQGAKCYNMAFDSPIYHEYGHFVDNIFGQVERSNNIEMGMSEGWGDILSAFVTGHGFIGLGMYKDIQTDGFYLRSLYDQIKWFDPLCLTTVNPGPDCNPDLLSQACSDLGTTQEILECRRYHYGQVWASMVLKLRDRIAGINGGDASYANNLVVSALTADVQTIEDGLSKILNSDIPSSRIVGTEPKHLCTIQGVAREYGFNLGLIPELENFSDCFLKTYPEGTDPEDISMFTALIRDGEGNFHASGYYEAVGAHRRYYHKKVDENGDVDTLWTDSLYNSVFPGFHDRARTTLDLGTKYLIGGLVGSPTNLPGANIWMGEVDKTTGELLREIGPYGTTPIYNSDYPQLLDGIQSIQPLADGTYIITGLTSTFQEPEAGGPADCTPAEPEGYSGPPYPAFTPCGDAYIGFLDASLNPEVGPAPDYKPFDIRAVGGEYSDLFNEAKQITSGEIVISGGLVNIGTGRDAVLIRSSVGSTGSRVTPDPAGDAYTRIESGTQTYRDFIEVNTGGAPDGFLAVGYSINNSHKLIATRLNNALDSTPIWDKTYEMPGGGFGATSVRQYADESGFLIAGKSHPQIVLLKLDNDGNEVWCNKYPRFWSDFGPDVELTSDGTGFLVAGQFRDFYPPYSMTAAIMRITLDGDAPTDIQSCNLTVGTAARQGRQSARIMR